VSVTVFFADPYRLVRELVVTLTDREPDLCVTGHAGDLNEALESLAINPVDVVVAHAELPSDGCVQLAWRDELKILALYDRADVYVLRRFFDAGGRGCVSLAETWGGLLRAIRTVANKQVYVDPRVSFQLTDRKVAVTEREFKVAQLRAFGYTMAEIADQFGVGVKSIETYAARFAKKTKVKSRVELMQYAASQGWFESMK
jgi:DNA-binding NarL/FixJ family response regulator